VEKINHFEKRGFFLPYALEADETRKTRGAKGVLRAGGGKKSGVGGGGVKIGGGGSRGSIIFMATRMVPAPDWR